jgi:hypothetical protein
MGALAQISGGMSCLVHSLGDNIKSCRNDVQVTDIIGALTYALKVFNEQGSVDSVNVVELESLLIKQLEPSISRLMQRCAVEALSCLYGNAYLHRTFCHTEAKKLLVGLITTSNSEVQIKENVDAIGYYQVHPLTVIVHSETKPSKLVTLKFEYLLKLHVVCVGVDGMQGGSENNFLINLFPDSTGIELPHQIAKLSSGLNFAYDEKRAQRPFKWVQHLAGIDFLPEAPPFLVDNISEIEEAAKGASTFVSTQKRTDIFEGKMPNLVGKFD